MPFSGQKAALRACLRPVQMENALSANESDCILQLAIFQFADMISLEATISYAAPDTIRVPIEVRCEVCRMNSLFLIPSCRRCRTDIMRVGDWMSETRVRLK